MGKCGGAKSSVGDSGMPRHKKALVLHVDVFKFFSQRLGSRKD